MNTSLYMSLLKAKRAISESYALLKQADDLERQSNGIEASEDAAGATGCLIGGGMALGIALLFFVIAAYALKHVDLTTIPDWAIVVSGLVLLVALPVLIAWRIMMRLLFNELGENGAAPRAKRQEAQVARKKAEQTLAAAWEAISCVPEQYRYPYAVDFLCRAVESGAAESMFEAGLLLEEHLHRQKMEAAYVEILAEQKRQTALMQTALASLRLNTALTFWDAAR